MVRKQNLIRAEFAKAKVAVEEQSVRKKNELSIDPKSPFTGRRLTNGQNICYLNSSINALLSLRSIREYILASEPVGLVKSLRMVLNGSKSGEAELMRQALETEFGERYDFRYNEQVFVGDALDCILEALTLNQLCNYSVTLKKKCPTCRNEFSQKTSGMLHFFNSDSSTRLMTSGKSNEEFECPTCQKDVICTEEVSISESNLFMMIGCTRPEGNNRKVYPTRKITTSDGKTYAIKAVINYYMGSTCNEGHYDTSVFVNDEWKIVQDLTFDLNEEPVRMDSSPDGGLIFFYEREDLLQSDDFPIERNHFKTKLLCLLHYCLDFMLCNVAEHNIKSKKQMYQAKKVLK